jgi:phage terminase small subunit
MKKPLAIPKTKPELKIKDSHLLFIKLFLKYNNASRAYREVYPNATIETSRSNSCQLLKRPEIKAIIDTEVKSLKESLKADLDTMVYRMTALANANMQDYLNKDGKIDVDNITRDQAQCIESLKTRTFYDKEQGKNVTETEIKLFNPFHAIKALGQHFGGFSNKLEVKSVDNLDEKLIEARRNQVEMLRDVS